LIGECLEQIGWFDIAVDDALAISVLQAASGLNDAVDLRGQQHNPNPAS
jgi:hypothetical protein